MITPFNDTVALLIDGLNNLQEAQEAPLQQLTATKVALALRQQLIDRHRTLSRHDIQSNILVEFVG